jgi:DNA topoisomerase I
MGLLSLPREVGKHPESGEPILAGIGRFGPYIKHGDVFKSIRGEDDVLTIGLNRAVVLLAEASAKRRTPPGKMVGEHPADKKPITLHSGRYGPYLRHANILASLPKGMGEDEVTVENAVTILAAQAEKKKAKGGKSGGTKRKSKKAAVAEDSDGDEAEAKPTRKRAANE